MSVLRLQDWAIIPLSKNKCAQVDQIDVLY